MAPEIGRLPGISRRATLGGLATLLGHWLGGSRVRAQAGTCVPRGAACSVLQTCCGDARCKWLEHNPFVGVCGGGRQTPPGVPSGTTSRWSTPRGAVTCDDFVSQRDARHYLRRFGDRFSARLDPDGDGRPCENLPRK